MRYCVSSEIICGNVHAYGIAAEEGGDEEYFKVVGKKTGKNSYSRQDPHAREIYLLAVCSGDHADQGKKRGIKSGIL